MMVYWTDIELDRELASTAIRQAMADVFALPIDAVDFASLTDLDAPPVVLDPQVQIVMDRWTQAGEFPLHLMIVLRNEALDAQVSGRDATIQCLRAFCQQAGCNALASDEVLSDETWLLIRQTGEAIPVQVDGDALDDDRLIVVQSPAVTSHG